MWAGKPQPHYNSVQSHRRWNFRPFFLTFEKCRPEVADDVKSGSTIDKVGMDARVKFSDSRLDSDQIIRL